MPAEKGNERLSANGGGRYEVQRPRAAGYVRGRAPDKTTGIRQDATARTAKAGSRGHKKAGPEGSALFDWNQIPGRAGNDRHVSRSD